MARGGTRGRPYGGRSLSAGRPGVPQNIVSDLRGKPLRQTAPSTAFQAGWEVGPLPRANTFESIPLGERPDSNNTVDGGDQFTDVQVTGTATLVADDTHVATGTQALSFQKADATSSLAYGAWLFEAASDLVSRFYLWVPTGGLTSNLRLLRYLNGATIVAGVTYDSAIDQFELLMTSTGNTNAAQTTLGVPKDQLIRVETRFTLSTTTGGATGELRLYLAHDTTPVETISTTNVTGATTATEGRSGAVAATTGTFSFWIDDPKIAEGPAFLGPSYVPPVTVDASGGAATGDGGTVALQATVLAATGASTAAGGTATLRSTLPATAGAASAAGGTATPKATLIATAGAASATGPPTVTTVTLAATGGAAAAAGGTMTAGTPVVVSAVSGSAAGAGGTATLRATIIATAGTSTGAGGGANFTGRLTAQAGAATAAGGASTITVTLAAAVGQATTPAGTAALTRTVTATAGAATATGGASTFTARLAAATGASTAAGGNATAFSGSGVQASNGTAAAVGGTSSLTATLAAQGGASTATGGPVTVTWRLTAIAGAATAAGGTVTAAQTAVLSAVAGNATAAGTPVALTYAYIAGDGLAVAAGGDVGFIGRIPILYPASTTGRIEHGRALTVGRGHGQTTRRAPDTGEITHGAGRVLEPAGRIL